MACAVHTTLPAGVRYTTLELKVNDIRSVALDAGRITAEGRVIHVGRTAATAESKALDDSGKLVAHATTCMIFRPQYIGPGMRRTLAAHPAGRLHDFSAAHFSDEFRYGSADLISARQPPPAHNAIRRRHRYDGRVGIDEPSAQDE